MQPDLALKPDAKGEFQVRLFFNSQAEKDRFDAVCPSVELSDLAVQKGYEGAVEKLVPALMIGVYGSDEASIERMIETVIAGGKRPHRDKATRDHERALDLCWRVGTRSALMAAKEAFLAQLAALEKGTEALTLLAAGMNAAADAMDMAAKLAPAPAAPPRHTPSLGSRPRPLRPEDFGTLPAGPRR